MKDNKNGLIHFILFENTFKINTFPPDVVNVPHNPFIFLVNISNIVIYLTLYLKFYY